MANNCLKRLELFIYYLVLFFIFPRVQGADDVCSRGICQCSRTDQNGSLVVNCNNGRLEGVPDRIPADTSILYLAYNSLSSIEENAFHTLTNLKRLDLSNNVIEDISPAAFRNLHHLESLDLEENRLSETKQRVYRDLLDIKSINFDANNIKSFDHKTMDFALKLAEITMKNNSQETCSCELKALRDWARTRDPLVILTGVTCNGKPLVDVQDEEFGNCSTAPFRQSCMQCEESASLLDCRKKGRIATCDTLGDVCYTILRTGDEDHKFSMGCAPNIYCVKKYRENVRECKQAANYQKCHTCCSGSLCHQEVIFQGYTYTMKSTLTFVLLRNYTRQLNNITTAVSKNLIKEITSKISPLFDAVGEKSYISVESFGPHGGFIMAHSKITSRIAVPVDYVTIQQELYDNMVEALSSAKLQLDIDPKEIVINGKTTCSAQRMETGQGVFDWPATRINSTVVLKCPVPRIGSQRPIATRNCWADVDGSATWQEPTLSECAIESDRTRDLKNLIGTAVTVDTMPNITERLADLTSLPSNMTGEEVEYAVQVIDRVVWSPNTTLRNSSTTSVMEVYNNLLQLTDDILLDVEIHHQSASRIVQSIDHLANKIDLEDAGEMKIVKPNIGLTMVASMPTLTGAVFQTSPGTDGDLRSKNVHVEVNQTRVNPADIETAVSIPASAFSETADAKQLLFVVYDKSKYFEILDKVHNTSSSGENYVFSGGRKLNTKVIAATFQSTKLENLKEPIVITFRHLDNEFGDDPNCVFWDFSLVGDRGGGWSGAGCELAENTREYTTCHCHHLTSFAAIMDIYGNGGSVDSVNKKALSIISYVGCAISLAALLATLLTYTMFRKLRSDNPSKILMNLCSAIIALLVLFILCTQPVIRANLTACKALAGFLHYALLSMWMWMVVEAFYMYLALVKVFKTYYSKFLLKCSLVGWGIPAVIVLITVAISRDNYGPQGEICWLSRHAFFGAALAPIGVVLILNFVAFGMVIHQLRALSAQKLEKSKNIKMDFQTQLRGAISVVVLLGLTWVFAVFAIGGANLVFQYLFSIFNSLQGLFIFIFYCVMKKDVTKLWRKKITGQLSSSHLTSSKGYTSSTPMSGGQFNNKYKPSADSPTVQSRKPHNQTRSADTDQPNKTRL